jgi:hypothetical protein
VRVLPRVSAGRNDDFWFKLRRRAAHRLVLKHLWTTRATSLFDHDRCAADDRDADDANVVADNATDGVLHHCIARAGALQAPSIGAKLSRKQKGAMLRNC